MTLATFRPLALALALLLARPALAPAQTVITAYEVPTSTFANQFISNPLGLDFDVFFLQDRGAWDDVEMRGLFQVADALFFPSRQEGFGLPLLEAAIDELPPPATATPTPAAAATPPPMARARPAPPCFAGSLDLASWFSWRARHWA